MFFIKHLRSLGFSATNDIFTENAWYFQNALVRANYTNLQKDIHETTEYLEILLRNLLLGEDHELHSRSMHISGLLGQEKVDIQRKKWIFKVKKRTLKRFLPMILLRFLIKPFSTFRFYLKNTDTKVLLAERMLWLY